MDEIDEAKPQHEADVKEEEEETQPEPDEHLAMEQGGGRAWSVKIPKHLMEQWGSIDAEGIHLATMRVYDKDPRTGRRRIALLVPHEPRTNPISAAAAASSTASSTETAPPQASAPVPTSASVSVPQTLTPGTYDEYELEMVNDKVPNQCVVAEREKAPGSRARTTILTGHVRHECSLRPMLTQTYLERMRRRAHAASTPKRTVKLLDEFEAGGAGRLNMISAGVGAVRGEGGFASLVKAKPKPIKGAFERFARMPRNQLLDMLFALFRERPRWAGKDLRSRTEQPEAYLKEVLSEIADLHRSGEHTGMYELKANFKVAMEETAGAAAGPSVKSESAEIDEDDEGDESDDDMEEIS